MARPGPGASGSPSPAGGTRQREQVTVPSAESLAIGADRFGGIIHCP